MQLQQQESALNFLTKKLHQHQHPGGKAYKRIDLVCCWFALLKCRYTPVYLDEVIEDVHAVANFGSMSTLQVINQMLSVGRFHFGHIGWSQ